MALLFCLLSVHVWVGLQLQTAILDHFKLDLENCSPLTYSVHEIQSINQLIQYMKNS